MNDWLKKPCTAFEGHQRIATGELSRVALTAKHCLDAGEQATVLIFDDATGEQIDVDFRGTDQDLVDRLEKRTGEGSSAVSEPIDAEPQRRVGRPRLGVVAREVTLLPRHWDWLAIQPGGASVALRKLVDEARRTNEGKDRVRQSQEAAYRFMSALAGNLPGFEEATRALFAANSDRFHELVGQWPSDVRDHAKRLAAVALGATDCAAP